MPYEVIKRFEDTIARYAGANYGIAVSSCTNAIFLCLKYLEEILPTMHQTTITIPKKTYVSIACAIKNAGYKIKYHNNDWQGIYKLYPYELYDSALRFKKDMYIRGSLYCLSFHIKKHVPIGRGGMILTDSKDAYLWLRRARFDGRDEVPMCEDKFFMLGYNMYLTPEQAARGLQLFDLIKNKDLPDLSVEEQGYPDLTQWEIFK